MKFAIVDELPTPQEEEEEYNPVDEEYPIVEYLKNRIEKSIVMDNGVEVMIELQDGLLFTMSRLLWKNGKIVSSESEHMTLIKEEFDQLKRLVNSF